MNRCPCCHDERLQIAVGLIEAWTYEGKVRLTEDDWIELVHAIGYDRPRLTVVTDPPEPA